MKYIALAFGKLLFYMGIPFSLLLLYVLYTNSFTEIKQKKLKISFVDTQRASTKSSTLIPVLGGFDEKNQKQIITKEYNIEKMIKENDENDYTDSLKYLLPDNRIIGIGSIIDVWVPPLGGYYIKYENESYKCAWFRVSSMWLFGLFVLNLYPLSLLIKMIFRRKSTLT